MPKAWSDKDERQFKHVKQSEREAGKSMERAEEIAARTVNKQRAKEGRTISGGASAHAESRLEARTKDELLERADKLSIKGRASMNKDELIKAIRERN
jgi:hypothetical protein